MMHFALRDLSESALALVCFLPLFFAPGYLLAWFGNIAGFRRASWIERVVWSIPLSMATGTLLMVWTSTFFGLWFSVACCGAMAAGAAGLIGWELWNDPASRAGLRMAVATHDRYSRLALLMVLLWCVAALLQLVELQWGQSLMVSVTIRDHSYRAAFIDAVLRSGVPPTNPLYDTGHPVLMRNYYFWYVVCAVVCKGTMLAARNVLVASCAWAATAMFCLAALCCKYFLAPKTGLRRTALISMLLFWVTGLDILMVLYLHFFTPIHRLDGDMEWWDIDHFPSWLDNFLYVPHHVASMACCLTSLMVLWVARESTSRASRWLAIVLAAVAFTSAFGLSIYVAFAFAFSLLLWCLWLRTERQFQLIRMMFTAGALGAVLIVPFLLQLRSETKTAGSKQSLPLTVRLRDIYGLDDWSASVMSHSHFWTAHAKVLRSLQWLVLVVPDLTLELGLAGLFGVLAWWQLRRGRLAHEPGTRALVVLAGCGMVATMVIRSSVSQVNDYGFRTAMIPLFFFLVLGARFVAAGLTSLKTRNALSSGSAIYGFGKPLRAIALVFLVLGVTATVYQAVEVRFFLTLYGHNRLRDRRQNAAFPGMNQEVYQARVAYNRLSQLASPLATVQYNPATIGSYFLWVNMMDARRQIIAAEPGCGKSFGGDESACPVIEAAVDSLYTDPAPNRETALNICHSLGIDYLVAADQDPAWQDPASWVWSAEPVVAEKTIRIVRCR